MERSSKRGGADLSKFRVLERSSPEDLRILREALRSGLDDVAGGEPVMEAALTHVLAHPGNLGRARICLATGRRVGLDSEAALALAMAVEYFHTASLVFDDLPCMDDADERRHAPCVHKVYGEPAAVLAGLALVNRAYRLVWTGMSGAGFAERQRASGYVDACLGVFGLLGGQSQDLHDQGAAGRESGVMEVARLKTVPLLRLAVLLPVILTGGSERLVQVLERLCVFRGLAYQIADDLKDVTDSDVGAGKTSGRDEALGRPNLARAAGLDGAIARLARLNHLGDRTMAMLPGGAAQWSFLDLIRPRESVAECPAEQPRTMAVS
jgi:geranylgeranyl diphosphate synthase type II